VTITEQASVSDRTAEPEAYQPRRPSRSLFVESRSLRHHVRVWGEPGGRPVVMVHGAMDAAITFQFLVDAMADDWYVVAPDLRGYGQSDRAQSYAFPDYLFDLDGLLGHFFPDEPVPLVGHSLGGNVVSIYAGVRPARVERAVSLDGFGLPDRRAADAPDHLARWIDRSASPIVDRLSPHLSDLADRLRQTNPNLDAARALFLARHLSRETPDGFGWAFDPRHRLPFAALFRLAEWETCLARATAPALWVASGQTVPAALETEPGGVARRASIARATFRRLAGTSHNLHHDEPAKVAALIEPFLAGAPVPA
jgi:pimeloyl-ACP methyl ester carboxylesterase